MKKWRRAWHNLHHELLRNCDSCGGCSIHLWKRLRWRRQGVRMAGRWYCRTECLALELGAMLRRGNTARETAPARRIPLGLLLLSRRQLTVEQLRTALSAQREAGQGRIGEWLQRFGYVSGPQIVAALARQWSCPVLRGNLSPFGAFRMAPIPLLLLETFRMIPAGFSDATGTLLMAFSDCVDHTVLYAIGQMLGCRTEACAVSPGVLQRALEELAERRTSRDVVFDRMEDAGECARIIGSYTTRLQAEEVRMTQCGTHLWIRLERSEAAPVNLVLRAPVEAPMIFREIGFSLLSPAS
jgi:hypothetical protein